MHWKIKAFLQKILAGSPIGDWLNHIPITLSKSYHRNTFLYQTYECLRKFSYSNIDLNKKCNALEIGTGYSVVSAIVQSLLGFEKVVTTDVTKDLSFHVFKKQLQYFDGAFIKRSLYKAFTAKSN